MRMKSWLIVGCIGLAGSLAVFLWLGPGEALIGAGVFPGVFVGAGAGNKKARKVEEYRNQWLRKRQGNPPC